MSAQTCHVHVAGCYQCRRDRTRVAYLRRLLTDPDTAGTQARERFQRTDERAHEEHLDACESCQTLAAELCRMDREVEQLAMQAAAHVVWPDGRRLPPRALARRVNGWNEP